MVIVLPALLIVLHVIIHLLAKYANKVIFYITICVSTHALIEHITMAPHAQVAALYVQDVQNLDTALSAILWLLLSQ
jgi:hypothetical protein